MATKRTCVTSEEGWALYHHFLGNLLNLIPYNSKREREQTDEDEKYKFTREVDDIWGLLVGNLYLIMRRMKLNGHNDTADKMQQIIDMVVELDLTDQEVCRSIHDKETELSPRMKAFQDELANQRSKRAE